MRACLSTSRRAPGIVLLLALAGSGCTTVQQGGTQRTALTEVAGGKTSGAELRAMINSLAISVPAIIEAAGDEVGAYSTDASWRRRAILWKIEVIPAFYQALFYPDSLAGAVDAWSLAIQLEETVTIGAWRDRLGPLQPAASKALHEVREQIEVTTRASARSADGYERVREWVQRWARDHPVVGPISSRPSVLPELVRKAEGGPDISVFQVMADIPATVADLATRLDIYAAYLPKAARWQAELLAEDFSGRAEAQRVLATLASVERLTERTNALLSPEGIRGAADQVAGQIRAERIAALASVDSQRVETLAYLTRERVAAVAEIERQREAMVQQLDELRRKVLADAEQLARRVIRQAALAVGILLVLAAVLTVVVITFVSGLRHRKLANRE